MSVAQGQKPARGNSPPKNGYQNSKAEDYARWRRRDHANIEAVQNLAISRIAAQTSVEMPPNVRTLISALQGAHGGGEVAFEPFSRDYLTMGRQLQFTGTDEAIRQRVRRWVDDLLGWQRATCFELFSVVKGGEIIGQRPDGAPIRKATTLIDNFEPNADDAVQRARSSELWRGNAEKGIKPHPGRALEAEVESLLKALPRCEPEVEGEKKGSSKLSVGEYERDQEDRLKKRIEAVADEIEERDGDSDPWLERMEKAVRKMRDSRRKTAPARRSWIMLDDNEAADPRDGSGNTNTGITPEPPIGPEADRLGIIRDTQAEAETVENAAVSEADLRITDDTQAGTDEPSMLEWALTFASRGIKVLPLNSVFDGICSCLEGSECRSAGKHPLARLAPHGVKDATTDEATIRRWFNAEPHANVGIAMGGPLRLLGLDVDPRAGGDASLCDLVEAHGDGWLETFTVRSGGLGNHFIFRLPEGVGVHRSKLAPGIDVKAEGGSLVAPPSIHVSGRRYEVERICDFAEAPAWLVEELTRAADEPARIPIDFQTYRDRKPAGGGGVIVEGERNERLFKVGCAIWGKGEVLSRSELFQRLMETNLKRVSPPLASDEVWKLAESVSSRYPLGAPIHDN